MPVHIDAMTAITDMDKFSTDAGQDRTLAYHRRHIQALWYHIQQLESVIAADSAGSLVIKVGAASVVLKKNGDVIIKGNEIAIEATNNINIKAGSNVVMKGNRILQN